MMRLMMSLYFTETQFDSSPTWLYIVSGVTFVCIIAASVIVLICRYITHCSGQTQSRGQRVGTVLPAPTPTSSLYNSPTDDQ